MAKFIFLSIFTLAVAAQPCLAKRMPKHVPTIGEGESQGVDPEVARFQKAMEETKAELAAIKAAILATQISPVSKSAAALGGLKAAQEFAATAAVMAKANAAHKRFVAHMMGYKGDNVDEELGVKAPAFSDKNDDKTLKQKKDYTLKGAGRSAPKARRSPLGPQQAHGGGDSRNKFASMSNNPVSYGATSGGLENNFGEMSNSRMSGGASTITGAAAVGTGAAGAGQGGGGAAPAGAGGGQAVGPTSGVGSDGSDAAATINDMNRMNQKTIEMIDSNNEQIKERQKKAEQGMSPEQLAGMAGPAMQAASQAMKGAEKGSGECKNCGKSKAKAAQQGAQTNPAP